MASKWTTQIDATGSRGNIFMVLSAASRLLRQLDAPKPEFADMSARVMKSQSYNDALDIVREWFPVITDDGEE